MRIAQPHELYDIVGQLRQTMAQATFDLAGGNCRMEEISPDLPWPADYVELVLVCRNCGKKFRLYAETYHGAGGWWEPVTPDP